jgi:hypothetical protein
MSLSKLRRRRGGRDSRTDTKLRHTKTNQSWKEKEKGTTARKKERE